MSELTPDQTLLEELEPTAERLFERHLANAKEWFPHEFVPWSRGQDFEPDERFNPKASPASLAVRSALLVNLLTEDNLPHYTRYLYQGFGGNDVYGEWNRRWTAEEGRHSIVIRDYLTVMRLVDLQLLERERMKQVSGGQVPNPPNIGEGIVYVSMQELATRIAHRNTGKLLDDSVGEAIMSRVAADENLHHVFYRDLAIEFAALRPSDFVVALDNQVEQFEMPGTGITDFIKHAALISRAGVYGIPEYTEGVVGFLLDKHFDISKLEGLTPEADQARDRLYSYVDDLAIDSEREKEKRAKRAAKTQPQ